MFDDIQVPKGYVHIHSLVEVCEPSHAECVFRVSVNKERRISRHDRTVLTEHSLSVNRTLNVEEYIELGAVEFSILFILYLIKDIHCD